MLAKSIIAGTVLSLMAGGVVYFGTDVDAGELKDKVAVKTAEVKAEISDKVMAGGEDHPHDDKSKKAKMETSIDTPSLKTESGKVIEAKKPTISYSSDSETKNVKTAEVVSPEKPQKKWLNQYLKSEKPKEKAPEKETESAAENLMESMGLTKSDGSDSDTGRFIVEEEVETLTEEQIETAEAEGFEERALETENIWVEEGSENKGVRRKMLKDIIKKDRAIFVGDGPDGEKKVEVKVIANEDGETRIETETIDMGDGKIMKIVKKTVKSETKKDDGDMRIRVLTEKDGKGGMTVEDIRGLNLDSLKVEPKDISGTVQIVMAQAEKIEMPELRDRAYLDLVSYALKHDDYKVAAKALKKIEQTELRDTARNRIAIAHAKAGDAENAFGILDDIEVDALRDVMRLQVIEAMIAPEELPKDMQ